MSSINMDYLTTGMDDTEVFYPDGFTEGEKTELKAAGFKEARGFIYASNVVITKDVHGETPPFVLTINGFRIGGIIGSTFNSVTAVLKYWKEGLYFA